MTAGKVPDGIGAAKTPFPASDGAAATAGITGEAVIQAVDVRVTDARAVVVPADILMLVVPVDALVWDILVADARAVVVPVVDILVVAAPVADMAVVDMAVADITSNSQVN
jgi:hypothetical protein